MTDQTLLTLLVLAVIALSYGAGYANGYSQCRKDRNREVHESV